MGIATPRNSDKFGDSKKKLRKARLNLVRSESGVDRLMHQIQELRALLMSRRRSLAPITQPTSCLARNRMEKCAPSPSDWRLLNLLEVSKTPAPWAQAAPLESQKRDPHRQIRHGWNLDLANHELIQVSLPGTEAPTRLSWMHVGAAQILLKSSDDFAWWAGRRQEWLLVIFVGRFCLQPANDMPTVI